MRLTILALFLVLILSCEHNRDSEWSVVEFPSAAGKGSGEPSLVTIGDTLYMSWFESDGRGSHDLKVAGFANGKWEPPVVAASGKPFFVNWADFPILRNVGGNRLGVHWLEKNGEAYFSYEVRVSLSDDGGKNWTSPVIPHTDRSQGEHGFVSLVTEEDGGFGAIWLDGRNITVSPGNGHHEAEGDMSLLYGRYENGTFINETVLDSRVCDCCQTDAVSIPGGILAVYRDRSAEELRDMSYIRRVGGKWSEPKTLFPDGWQIAACPVNGPAADSRGNRVAVGWFTGTGGKGKVQIVFSDNAGETFSSPVQVDLGNPSGRVDLLLLDDGSAVISWLENVEAKGARILLRRVHSDGRMENPVTVADSSQSRASGFPRMSLLGDDLIFAWTWVSDPPQIRMAKVTTGNP